MSTTNPFGSEALTVSEAAEMLENSDLLADMLPDEGEQDEQVQAEADEVNAEDESEEQSDDESGSDDEEESENGSEQPETLRVKVDGQEVEVTLDELKSGYSRTQDYTKKTQEVAQARKTLEAELQQVNMERQQYAQVLGKLAEQLQVQEPDWETLRATDPIEYSLQMADYQRNMQKRQIAMQEQQRVMAQVQADNQRQMQTKLASEAQALAAMIPEWNDKEKAQAVKDSIKTQGKKIGFSDDELANVFDHRAVLALYKAAKYDELMSKRDTVKPKATQKVLRPSGKGNPGNLDAKKAHARALATGRDADVVKAIESLL